MHLRPNVRVQLPDKFEYQVESPFIGNLTAHQACFPNLKTGNLERPHARSGLFPIHFI